MAKSAIATEYVQLAASADGIGKSINNALKGVGGNAGSSFAAGFGSVMGNVAFGAAKATGAALKNFAQSTIETGSLFDSSMSQVAATLGYSVAELNKDGSEAQQTYQKLSEFAQEMGRTTKFTAAESAEALNYMALAGYDAETSIEMLPNVLNLAAAGSMDLARASDMITDSQTAFGISLDRTSQMVDEMAKAASTGNTSVEQLGDAFLTVGGLAKELNGGMTTLADGTVITMDGVQELEVALTSMANAGIKGSEAGTHMRNMLLKLSDPTSSGVKALNEMGVAVYDAEGNMRSLTDIMGGLNEAMGEMTQQEKISTISDLFNTRDVASAEALMAAFSDTIVKCGDDFYSLAEAQELFGDAIYDSSQGYEIIENDWNKIAAAITDADNAAENMAGTQLDNLAGDMTLFNSALDGAKLAISNDVTPSLRDFVQFGTDGISRLTSAFKEGGLEGAISELGSVISEGMALAMEKAPEIMNAAFSLLKSLSMALMQNLPLITQTGLSILIDLVNGITSNISTVAPMLVQTLVSVAQILIDNLPILLSGVIDLVRQLSISMTQDGLPILAAALPGLITGIVNFALGFSSEFTQLVFDVIDIILSEFPAIAMQICAELPTILTGIISALSSYGPELTGAILDLTIQSLVIIPIIASELAAAIPTIFKSLKDGFRKNLPIIKEVGMTTFEAFIKTMTSSKIISEAITGVGEFFGNILGAISLWFTEIRDEFVSGITVAIDAFTEFGEEIMSAVEEFFRPAVEEIITIWSWFDDTFGPLLDALQNLVEACFEYVYSIAVKIWTNIKNYIVDTIWNPMVSLVQTCVENLKSFVESGFLFIKEKIFIPLQAVWEKVQEVWQNVKGKFEEVILAIHDYVAEKFEAIRMKIEEPLVNAQNKVSEIFGSIKDTIKKVVDDALQWGKDLVGNFVRGITENVPGLTDAVDNMAKNVRDRTHFSKPDKGPLADFDTYAPDMMKLFAKGIRDNTNVVLGQVERSFDFGSRMATNLQPAAATVGGYAEGTPIVVNLTLPVNIGQKRVETIVMDAINLQNYISGGR